MAKGTFHLDSAQIGRLIDSLRGFLDEPGSPAVQVPVRARSRLLDAYRDFLGDFLGEDETGRGEAAGRLARACLAREVPFVLLMACFNHVKEDLVRYVVENEGLPPERHLECHREVDRIFERAKRDTAHAYLRAQAARPDGLPQTRLRDKTLVRLCLEWLERVRLAVAHDPEAFPLEPAASSPFVRALRYPESMMICLDLKLCDQLQERHQLLHRQAAILYALLRSGRYEQAYLAYQDLMHEGARLLNLLAALYYEAQSNRIHRFFEFLQAALYLPGRKFLCVLNLRRLERINQLYGKETGDRALAIVESALRDEHRTSQEWMHFVRGIAGDFYLVCLDDGPGRVQDLLVRVREAGARGDRHGLPMEIELVSHGVELTRFEELTTESMHLLVQYLTERARRGEQALETRESDIEAVRSWMKDRYRRSLDLRGKLNEEGTDIFIQPLVTLDERHRIHAFEVLGRFREGEGHLAAGLFIDDIIRMGLVTEFDRLVLAAVARHAEALRTITRRVFINVSADSLRSDDYLARLAAARRGPLRELELVLELTEQVLLEHRDLAGRLHREHGLSFAIDDFGTGYSTLQTVIELALEGTIQYLKLDGSLTRTLTTSPASERIMHITRQMAHELGLETVVEFVETAAQATRLRHLRMDLGQGYLFGIPDPVPVWVGKLRYLQSKDPPEDLVGFTL